MLPVETTEHLLSLVGEVGKEINSSDEALLYWKRQVAILSCDPADEERITSIRIKGQKMYDVNAAGSMSQVKGLTSTAIDSTNGHTIYMAPTRHDLTKTSISACKRMFQHTVSLKGTIRVAVVYSEEEGGIDGVDLGVYKAMAFTQGAGNYLVLERCLDVELDSIPKPRSVGVPVLVDRCLFRSTQEGRVAVLLRALDIPYVDETHLEQVSDLDGHKYHIDFMIYPNDPERAAYLEVKPFRPIREEVLKAAAVCRQTNVPVFIVWGKHFVQGIGKWNDKHDATGFRDVRRYEDGIRAMKVHLVNGRVECDEGYYFMTNGSAIGEVWEETDGEGVKVQVFPFDQKKIVDHLDKGKRRFNRTKRDRFRMTGRIRKTTRIHSDVTGKWYKPIDGFRSYLFKDTLEASGEGPGPSDCFSIETRAAFKVAEEYDFSTVR